MNKHEIFQKVKEHLLKQKARSMINAGCTYRGDGDMMCAVGCLIKDEYYSEDFEGIVLGSITDDDRPLRKALNKSGIRLTKETERLLMTLQKIHDCFVPSSWYDELDTIEKSM